MISFGSSFSKVPCTGAFQSTFSFCCCWQAKSSPSTTSPTIRGNGRSKIFMWLARIFIGGMWYQQMLWKLPPTFTDKPDGSGGLRYWMEEMGKYAAFKPHASLVNDLMLPNFKLFAFQVWAAETFIAVSLPLVCSLDSAACSAC